MPSRWRAELDQLLCGPQRFRGTTMKTLLAATALILAATPALAQSEPDGLKLPPGFHASVVAEGLGAIRHLAFRDNGDLYVSTARARTGIGGGVIAIKMKPDHTAGETEH